VSAGKTAQRATAGDLVVSKFRHDWVAWEWWDEGKRGWESMQVVDLAFLTGTS